MAVALILTIIPVTLTLVLLLLTTGGLSPLALVGFASLLALVVIVFVGILRAARRMQPSKDGGDRTRSEDPSEPAEEDAEAAVATTSRFGHEDAIAAPASRHAENSIATWDDEGGSQRP